MVQNMPRYQSMHDAITKAAEEFTDAIAYLSDEIDLNDSAIDITILFEQIGNTQNELKKLMHQVIQKFIETLMAHGAKGKPGEFVFGEKKYYIGYSNSIKTKSNSDIIRALMDATNGDFDMISACLASNPWKHSPVKSLVGEEIYNQLFEITWPKVLKTANPKLRLMTDNSFIHKGSK